MPDPALIFSDPADRAGTHVLLIGVGDYPWLEGGAKCTTPAQQDRAMGMGQLGALDASRVDPGQAFTVLRYAAPRELQR